MTFDFYVYTYRTSLGEERGLCFCSVGCGIGALDDGESIEWPVYKRRTTSRTIALALTCYGCDQSVAEIAAMKERNIKLAAEQRVVEEFTPKQKNVGTTPLIGGDRR